MKAITVRQPWASAMFLPDPKTIENRTYGTDYRGPLAIIASLMPSVAGIELLGDIGGRTGCVVGVVDLVDVHEQFSETCVCRLEGDDGWAQMTPLVAKRAMRHWLIGNPRELSGTYPYTGFLGIRDLGGNIAAAIERELGGTP